MVQSLRRLFETPSQTAGPYVHIGCLPRFAGIDGVYDREPGAEMVTERTRGERITITGRILDGTGTPLKDAMIEIWQADADGLHNSPLETRGTADPAFAGWGRQPTDADTGVYTFRTVRPGRVPMPDGRLQAPHVTVWIVARGINIGLHTRMYFADEIEANGADPLLNRIEQESRRETLIAPGDKGTYTFDIHLQGPHETVFLDI